MKIKINRNSIIIYGLIGLFIIAFGFFIFSFTYSSIENISVMSFKPRLDEYNKKEKEFLVLEESYKDWKNVGLTYKQFKEKYMIKFDDYPGFRDELQAMLSRNSLMTQDLKHKYKNIMDDIRRVSIDIKLVGSYMNLKRFIFEIENRPGMILFKDIQFSKKDVSNVSAKISLDVYFVR